MHTREELLRDTLKERFSNTSVIEKLNEGELALLSSISKKGNIRNLNQLGEYLKEEKIKHLDLDSPAPAGTWEHIAKTEQLYFKVKELDERALAPSRQEMSETKQKIVDMFKDEYPAIVHIPERTAKAIDELVRENKVHSIKEIKTRYIDVSKQLQQSNIFKEYKQLSSIMEGLRYCQHKEKNLHNKQEKNTHKQMDQER